ncbi:hypothetical protein [Moraxella sp. ZY210820]|uniref:hypothetical protein n=1 Tax=unclassified Moraxella TaxID=2685852 RepID=UPI002731BFB7|nr:hypothetical protein [Moraxella sp. ZY210820]WLF83537.1 hypothetical protein LU301_09760 [Moraxella sp. ZY210820]
MKNILLEKRVFASVYQEQKILVYALYNNEQKLYAIVAIHFLYEGILTPFAEYESLFHDLLCSELTKPYLEWYEDIHFAIQKHFEGFSE